MTAPAVPVVTHPDYVAPVPAAHRFPMLKFSHLADRLRSRPGGAFRFHSPAAIGRAALCLAHAPEYVDAVIEERLDARAVRRIGLPFGPALVRRSRRAVGGTLAAARLALRHGVACNTAGGSHHAHADHGAGFCVFNDVAVAAHVLLAQGAVSRIAVVDLDVHQGDGTADICGPASALRESVFTFSMHCELNYPSTKRVSHHDVGVAEGTGDDAYLTQLDQELLRVLQDQSPALVFYIAGVDVHEADRLGRLSLSSAGIAARERLVLRRCAEAGAAVCTVLGGGYADAPEAVAALHEHVFDAALEWGGPHFA